MKQSDVDEAWQIPDKAVSQCISLFFNSSQSLQEIYHDSLTSFRTRLDNSMKRYAEITGDDIRLKSIDCPIVLPYLPAITRKQPASTMATIDDYKRRSLENIGAIASITFDFSLMDFSIMFENLRDWISLVKDDSSTYLLILATVNRIFVHAALNIDEISLSTVDFGICDWILES